MKIAMITTWFPPTIVGSGNRFYEVGKRLSSIYEIHVFTTGVRGYAEEEKMEGMHIHRCGMSEISKNESNEKKYHMFKLKFCLDVLKRLDKSFDIIDCNVVSKPLSYVSFFASGHTPLILTWHEVWYEQNFRILNPALALPGFFLELFMPKLSDFNITVSQTTNKRLRGLLNADPDKISVISNGVDLGKFNEISVEKKYGRILYVGRLENHKCVHTLLLAYHNLKKTYNNIELILVGKGPQKKYLQNLSNNLNLKDIIFCDPMQYEKLIAIMKSSWILVLPSIREGQGIVLLEAMAAGTPPIAVKAEGSAVGDVVINNYNGLLVSQGELESSMKKLLTDQVMYENLRKNGLEFIKEYDWDKIALRTSEIYEMVKNKKR